MILVIAVAMESAAHTIMNCGVSSPLSYFAAISVKIKYVM